MRIVDVRPGLRRVAELKLKLLWCVPDYVKGFGGKFGVQTDRQDKSALGWDHQEKLQLHESQKGQVPGAFGLLKVLPLL